MQELREGIVDVSLGLARRILEELTDESVEAALLTRLHAELEALAQADERTRADLFSADGTVHVVSAGPLGSSERSRIEELVGALSARPADVDFDVDESLIAGARVEFSSQAVDATLADMVTAVRDEMAAVAPPPQDEADAAEEDGQ
jgi:hypothetical protein